jgi:ribosomal protein L37AE/L43A
LSLRVACDSAVPARARESVWNCVECAEAGVGVDFAVVAAVVVGLRLMGFEAPSC